MPLPEGTKTEPWPAASNPSGSCCTQSRGEGTPFQSSTKETTMDVRRRRVTRRTLATRGTKRGLERSMVLRVWPFWCLVWGGQS